MPGCQDTVARQPRLYTPVLVNMAAHGRSSITSSSMSGISASQPGLPVPLLPVSETLQSKASSLDSLPNPICHEDKLPLAVFYGPLDAKNPLLASLEREIQELLGFMKRKEALSTTEEKKHEFNRRGAMSLFNIWTKYAPRLPTAYYNEKLLKVGDSLCEMKEYKLALLQCYGRYLQQFSISFDENIADIQQFKTVFFPNGVGDQTAANTFHALNGRNICSYQLVCNNDLNMQNKESVIQCLNILSSLRLTMQVALPQEHLCWIIFNGTVYIYTICRKLMVIGQSSKALEYLLWASVCMESSVPLLSIRYLTWRVTLYTAVCQCYYDCQAAIHGETFARRGLAKIDELRQLELMGSSQPPEESRRYYREATIKMAVMIFKRAVFESRRKNRSFFRPKVRVNLKEVQALPWPRTITERLLDEMFDSTASRFLAVLEALSDSNRRTLQTGPIVTDEVEIRDVVSELFLAGRELLIMSNTAVDGMLSFPKTSLLQFIIERKNIISIDTAVKFTKLAFNYEEWSLFESAAGQLIDFLQTQDDPESKKAEKDLTLLFAMEPLINIKRNRGLVFPLENYKEGQAAYYVKKNAFPDTYMKNSGFSDDVFHLGAALYSCVCNSSQNVQPDKEIVVDMIMFLWQKCKLGIQRLNISRLDYSKFTQKISTNKWIYLLWQLNEVIHCYKTEEIDIVLVAEVALRLSEILETLGNPKGKFKRTQETSLNKRTSELFGTPSDGREVLPILQMAHSNLAGSCMWDLGAHLETWPILPNQELPINNFVAETRTASPWKTPNLCIPTDLCKCGNSPVYRSREMAARALVPFVMRDEIPTTIRTLLAKLPNCTDQCFRQNHIHGTLLQVFHLLQAFVDSKHRMNAHFQQELADVAVCTTAKLWLAKRQNPCLVTRAVYIDILFLLTRCLDKPTKGNQPVLEHLGIWEEVRNIISRSELITGFPYTFMVPGLPQYLQSLTKLAIAAMWAMAVQAGEQTRDVPISFPQLLESSFPDVRLLTLEALLERFSAAASGLGEKELPPLLWNMGKTFLMLAMKENHPECFCKILKILHCMDPSEWLHQTEHCIHLTPKEFLNWTMDVASNERSEIQSAALRLASKVIVHLMRMSEETRDAVAPKLKQWVQLVVSSCGDHLPTESRLAAAEVLTSTTPFFLTNPHPVLGLQDTLALWRCVLTLLQSEEQAIRDAATETVTTAMSQGNTCQSTEFAFCQVDASIALDMALVVLCDLLQQWNQLAPALPVLLGWLLGEGDDLMVCVESEHQVEEDYLFEKAEINFWAETLIFVKYLYKNLYHLLSKSSWHPLSPERLCHLQRTASEQCHLLSQLFKELPSPAAFLKTVEFTRLRIQEERTLACLRLLAFLEGKEGEDTLVPSAADSPAEANQLTLPGTEMAC